MKRIFVTTLTVALSGAISTTVPAVADPCAGSGDRAAVCAVQAFAASGLEKPQPIDLEAPILLPVGDTLNLELRAYDQFRRPFPTDRLAYGFEIEGCDDEALSVEQRQVGRFTIQAGGRRGDCRLWIWIPGDLNFEWPMVVRVEGRDRSGYASSEAEFVATRLYRALLGRDPDPSGLAETAAAIQRGDLERRVLTIVQSPEFHSKTDRGNSQEILERLYAGLLDREPDRAGIGAYLGQLREGRIVPVIMELINSEEFETKIIARDWRSRTGEEDR